MYQSEKIIGESVFQGGYSPEDQRLTMADFRKVCANGFGEDHNCYAHAMAWHGDRLFVCVTRAVLVVRGRARAALHPDYVGEIWPVRVPENLYDIDLRSQIWSYCPLSKKWEKVYTAPMIPGSAGFDVPLSVAFRTITVFQGRNDTAPALYIPASATSYRPETVMLKSYDGRRFDTVSVPGLGIDPAPRSLRGLVPFKGRLFTTPVGSMKRYEYNIADAMVILTSDDPDNGSWQTACKPNFGNPNNVAVFDMAEFNGFLYAGTANVREGFEVWKTDAEGDPPFKWTRVVAKGAHRGKLNQAAITLKAFGDYLYVGSAIQGGGWDTDNHIGPAAPEVIRISSDDAWELVAGEARNTPDGLRVPISGMGPGFNDPFSGYIWSMCVHRGCLYIGNLQWLSHAKFSDRTKWPKRLQKMIDSQRLEKLLKNFGGCDLWRSHDGLHWHPVTVNGFGNYYNFGIRSMASTPYGLFAGTANPYTPEVAVKRAAGWQYEKNFRGGLEVWQGAKEHCEEKGKKVRAKTEHASPFSYVIQTKGKDSEDDTDIEKIVADFYQQSDWRHYGLWRPEITDIKEACEELLAEVLAGAGDRKEGAIVDIGCAAGASTEFLSYFFSPEQITGVTSKKEFLKSCRRKAPQSTFVYRKLPRLKLPNNSFDYAMWLKGLLPLGDRRQLLTEVFQLLKPGGRLVLFDIIETPLPKVRRWLSFTDNKRSIASSQEYAETVTNAGFEKVDIIDVTGRCLTGFAKYRAHYLGLQKVTGNDDKYLKKVSAFFLKHELSISACLLVSAAKPLKKQ
ncbi:MAG: class I SAM-dependent methyltransferase [Desulfobulbaceae bacterium]|nr:class I SAM-dependent methyltransferase [Desulfobulbaceae bacterium]